MEIASGPRSNELAIPIRGSAVPTEKIFEADRDRGSWIERAAAANAALRSKGLSNSRSIVALCSTTFVLGIALTLTFYGRAQVRRPLAIAPMQPAPIAAPATTAAPATAMVIQPMPVATPTDAEILAGFAFAPARKPLARQARAVRPVRAARPAPSAEETASKEAALADPFADPTPAAKPKTKAKATAWVDPFAE